MAEDRLTAREIENQSFRRAFRGCDAEEVQLYLRSVASEFARLNLDNGELLEENGRLRRELEELRTREKTLQETLISAQRMSEELKGKAREEAELVIKQARLNADEIVRQARDELNRIEADISRSALDRDALERRLRGVIEQHLAMLDMRREARVEPDNLRVMPSRDLGSEVG